MLHRGLVLALRSDFGLPDRVEPDPENLLLEEVYTLSLYFFLQVSQVLPPAADASPEQRLGIKLIGLGRLPCQALPTMLEPGQQAFPL